MIEWDNKFSVNISDIDKDHKKFIDIINKAIAAKQRNKNSEGAERALNEAMQHISKHFIIEEIYMIKFNYPEYQYHRAEHLGFTTKTITYLNRIANGDSQIIDEILEYFKQWLVNHIQETDRKYIDCFNKNGLK